MNGLNLYITVSAVAFGLGSAILNLTGRARYKDNADFFESSNHELREQNTTLRDERTDLTAKLAKAQAESTQKDETIKQLKPFTDVVTTMSANHTQVMKALAEVTKMITGKVDGNKRARRE